MSRWTWPPGRSSGSRGGTARARRRWRACSTACSGPARAPCSLTAWTRRPRRSRRSRRTWASRSRTRATSCSRRRSRPSSRSGRGTWASARRRSGSGSSEAAARLGLTGVLDRHPYHLERGTRKLVAIASVVTMRTPILVLDEPTTGAGPADERGGRAPRRRPARRRHDDRVRVARHAAPGRRRGPPGRPGRGLGHRRRDATRRPVRRHGHGAAGLRPPQATALALRLRPASTDWPPLSVAGVVAAIRDGSAGAS